MRIAIVSHKGGTGKTTTAVNLAGCLSSRGSVLLVDGDMNRSSIHWAERGELPFKTVTAGQAPKYWRDYLHAIIDTQARPEVEDIRDLADICDLIILCSSPDALSLSALPATVETLLKAGAGKKYRILLTQVSPISKAGEEARAEITGAGWPILRGVIRRYACHGRAALEGKLVKDVSDPHASDAWRDIEAIGRELLK